MLLVIDVGNSHIVVGVMQEGEVQERWRITTRDYSTDEFGMVLLSLLQNGGWAAEGFEGAIVSCVVPSVVYPITKACRRYLKVEPLVVGSGVKTGIQVRTDNPREVGADRIVNAVAALDRWQAPLVVVDFGTATTFDCVDRSGAYVGGAIAPGLQISADALFSRTAKLPRVEVTRPESAIGHNTIDSMQAGLYYGYTGLVQSLARACRLELAGDSGVSVTVVATGGFSNLLGRACTEIDEIDEHLTLRGLSILWHRNA